MHARLDSGAPCATSPDWILQVRLGLDILLLAADPDIGKECIKLLDGSNHSLPNSKVFVEQLLIGALLVVNL